MSYIITRVDPKNGRSVVVGTASSAHEAEQIREADRETLDYIPDYRICFTPNKKEEDLHGDKQTEDR